MYGSEGIPFGAMQFLEMAACETQNRHLPLQSCRCITSQLDFAGTITKSATVCTNTSDKVTKAPSGSTYIAANSDENLRELRPETGSIPMLLAVFTKPVRLCVNHIPRQ